MQEKKVIFIKAKPLISIITLNWNQTAATCQFLDTTRGLPYKNYEVLVCDMGSAVDPTTQIIARGYSNTRVLKAESTRENLVNRAIHQAKGDFILLISNLTELTNDSMENLLAPFLSDPSLGVTCPKIRSFYNRNEIQYAGYKSLNIFTGKKNIIGNKKEDKGQFDTPLYTNGVYSGAMMMKKKVVEQAGMLPPNFFVYFDDSDFSARILNSGYRILYQPHAVVYNKARTRTAGKSAIQVFYNTRNRIHFMLRNSSLAQFSAFLFCFLLFTVPASTIQFLLKRQTAHLVSFYKGIWWNVKKRAGACI